MGIVEGVWGHEDLGLHDHAHRLECSFICCTMQVKLDTRASGKGPGNGLCYMYIYVDTMCRL